VSSAIMRRAIGSGVARRNPIPVRWLMTDERMGDALWPALRRLTPGSGVVYRHYATPARERRAVLRRVLRLARARELVLVVAGGCSVRADGVHGRLITQGIRTWRRRLLGSAPGRTLCSCRRFMPRARMMGRPGWVRRGLRESGGGSEYRWSRWGE
jgi:hypothetical protein